MLADRGRATVEATGRPRPGNSDEVVGEDARAELTRQVRDALRHLHDRPRLQTHPLARFVGSDGENRSAGRGRILQDTLLAAIEAMRPAPDAPADSPAGRSYQLLVRRYVEGEEAGDVQRWLAISKTEYYAEHQRAIEAIASWLGERWQPRHSHVVAESPLAVPALPRLAEASLHHNLPAQLTSFVGRRQETADVSRLLANHRLVTLTGTGGCGKTRLALHVAGAVVDTFAEGVWLVELAPLVDPALVDQAVAAAVGVREESGQPLRATLLAALRARRLLLLLDNCEHLLDACARLADVLLRGCPHLRILATSREALGIGGEVTHRVPSLTAPHESSSRRSSGCPSTRRCSSSSSARSRSNPRSP
jgi:hypothetical protein